ncbi:5-oxoprolinase subunit B family protein [Microbacterium sp. ASV81]|uniref:Carboxyltransferase domain-containing protein n=1 Tax=Microbacterium capsulatum TaxID=3041921 RepID=A0ABU0XJ42_9MICO|nr:carboxyltransferase domain-containing protein [Microbacterium sp. ASV81]MDQ4215157.1 carboxyltransferase domain-containing protein [Microbacterium sp. ASV81]
MSNASVVISPSGNSALRVASTLADREAGWRLVHHLARFVDSSHVPGVECVIPTYDAALIEIEPTDVSLDALRDYLAHVIEGLDIDLPLTDAPRTFDVPVLYDLDGELDLLDVAGAQGLSAAEIVRLHSEPTYVVRCLGAPGGSPMLDGPPFPHPVPRLASPRPHVPQGVVSVAGRQATITPAAAPGGWSLIGRTPLTVLDLEAEPFVPYEPGDLIRFRPIDRDEYEALRGTRMVAR